MTSPTQQVLFFVDITGKHMAQLGDVCVCPLSQRSSKWRGCMSCIACGAIFLDTMVMTSERVASHVASVLRHDEDKKPNDYCQNVMRFLIWLCDWCHCLSMENVQGLLRCAQLAESAGRMFGQMLYATDVYLRDPELIRLMNMLCRDDGNCNIARGQLLWKIIGEFHYPPLGSITEALQLAE
jgi:hypothetical protein